ncbi:MAG: hypothetical protein HQ478_02715 [Chloroflexi bacterium]|nr:hypothetical protein [Chloroflexota bacterium]
MGVGVLVGLAVGLGVAPGTSVGVGNGVAVGVAVGTGAIVAMGIGVAVATAGVGVGVGVSNMTTAVGAGLCMMEVAVVSGPVWMVAVATSGAGGEGITTAVGVGRDSGVASSGKVTVAVATGINGLAPLSGFTTGLEITLFMGSEFSTVAVGESVMADVLVGLGSSGSPPPHADKTTTNNAAEIIANFRWRVPIKDSMKSLNAAHNGCFTGLIKS